MDKHALTEKRESKISRQLNENNIEMHYHPIHRHRYWAITQCKTPTVRAVQILCSVPWQEQKEYLHCYL